MTTKFRNAPAPLWRDPRFWSLIIPAIAATLGSIAYAVQGFAVSNGGVLPAAWVSYAVKWGAVLLAVGCEGGTLTNAVEVFRKRAAGHAVRLDYVGLAISLVATVTARALALSGLQALWTMGLLVVASALDAYVGYMELGFYTAEADARLEQWLTASEYLQASNDLRGAFAILRGANPQTHEAAQLRAQVTQLNAQLDAADAQVRAGQAQIAQYAAQVAESAAQVAQLEAQVSAGAAQVMRRLRTAKRRFPQVKRILRAHAAQPVAQLRKAEISDWRNLTAHLNGQRAGLTKAEGRALITAAGLALPSPRAFDGWWRAFCTERGEEV